MGVFIFMCVLLIVFIRFGRLVKFLNVCWVVRMFMLIDGNLMYLFFKLYNVLMIFCIVLMMVVLLMLKFGFIVI